MTRAIQKIGQVLTSSDLLAELLGKKGLAGFGGSFPDYFQILLEFQTTDLSRYVNSYEVVRAWDVVAERWM